MEHRSSSAIQPHRQEGRASRNRLGQWHHPSHTASKLCSNGARYGSEAITHSLLLVCVSVFASAARKQRSLRLTKAVQGALSQHFVDFKSDLPFLLIMTIIIIAGMAVRSSKQSTCAYNLVKHHRHTSMAPLSPQTPERRLSPHSGPLSLTGAILFITGLRLCHD